MIGFYLYEMPRLSKSWKYQVINGCQRLGWLGERRGVTTNGYWVSFRGDENVLKLMW